ncbi:hypothetical protein N7462_009922 [Penicillium macrosclerotiorum]|uniref:uncharacterized protein n=1 Tax=Penicillium macrosclerotiorum TaxID=303699 RepID=UPI0025483FC5|nr:uncharacterized protein N7462_009922 [Penicillium macrosclerotiorum]KAJ5668852.1 hypothetical protein N7462_009922 [Penicillium macrosclerotiorum]
MPHPQVLFFDTFGTVVEWRSCVTKALGTAAQLALSDPNKDIPNDVRKRASALREADWLGLAEEWRGSYAVFTSTFDASKDFVSVDEHHHTALKTLLTQRGIRALFSDQELLALTFTWHQLEPWADSVPGLGLLNRRFTTSTLSNGNMALLKDLQQNGSLPFKRLVSAEDFGAYKPSAKVYLGAARLLGLEPSQCALVAAHLKDLQAAKSCGFYTVYVERLKEEAWAPEQVAQAKLDGFVDMWVDLDTGGFLEVARRFGIQGR